MKAIQYGNEAYTEARTLGVGFLTRHFKRWAPSARVPIKGVGPVFLRSRSSDARVFRQVFSERQYDLRALGHWPGIAERFDEIRASNRRPLIIDAGANNGASALWFAREFPGAQVVAIEPEPSSARICAQNTQGYDVDVLPMAIGSERGFVHLLTMDRESWAVGTERAIDGVQICTIPELVQRYSPECELFLVKIDIEGFESDLFAAHTDWVNDAKVLIVEPHDWLQPGIGTSRTFQKVLAALDFDLLIRGENLVYVRRDDDG